MDMSPTRYESFVLGGSTSDSGVTNNVYTNLFPIPIVAFVRDGGPYLWKNLYTTGVTNTNHDYVGAVKFLPGSGSNILAAFSVN